MFVYLCVCQFLCLFSYSLVMADYVWEVTALCKGDNFICTGGDPFVISDNVGEMTAEKSCKNSR